jgi:hypothetical protein
MPFVTQLVPNRRAQIKEDIVTQKFTETMNLANEFYEIVKTYVAEITNIAASMPDIDNTIEEPDVDLTQIDTGKLEELLRDFPVNPLEDVIWPDVPTENLDYHEDVDYQDTLFTAFDAKLQEVLDDATTLLNASIEDDIVDREAERDVIINQDAKGSKASDWAKSGFETPGSGLFSTQGQVDIDHQNKKLDKSRDVAVKSRELEIANTHKIIEEINKFEAIRMDFKAGYWRRKLEAGKALLERGTIIFMSQMEIIKAQAVTYQAITSAYGMHASALAELAKAKYQDIRARVEYASVLVTARVAELDSKIREAEVKYGISMDGAKTQGLLAAQVMASALSAVSASAHIASTDSANVSSSIQSQEQWTHYMDESVPG